ncbi:MAG: DUF2953 domain-containing protein [Syntrophomonas sp.]
MPALFVLAVFLLFAALSLLYIKFKVNIEYCEGEETKIHSTVLFPRFIKLKNELPIKNMSLTNWTSEQRIRVKLFKHMLIDELVWSTIIGLEDAMYTAISVGGIWACKGSLISYLKSQKRLKDFKINVTPDFSSKILLSELECIIKLRIGYIIYIAILLLRLRVQELYNSGKVNVAEWLRNKINLITEQTKKWGCWHGDARGKA